ncbi:MAG: hypothetical protein ACLTYW_01970 [Collinsella sp.]
MAIFGHALPSSILTGFAIPFLMSGALRSPAMDSPHGGRQTGMRFKPKTRKLKGEARRCLPS